MNKKPCKKTYFADEKAALEYIDKLQKTSSRDVVPKRAYLCTDCNNWHLTSKGVYSRTFDGVVRENEDLKKEIENLRKEVEKKENKSETIANLNKSLEKKNNKIKNLNGRINNLERDLSAAHKKVADYKRRYENMVSEKLTDNTNIMEKALKESGFYKLYKNDYCWYNGDLVFDPKTNELFESDEVSQEELIVKVTGPNHLKEVLQYV